MTLLVYVDMSASMTTHRNQLADMAGWITDELKAKCGDYEVLVNNLTYETEFAKGGEIVRGKDQPAWVTKDTPNGKEIIRRRIAYNSWDPAFYYTTMLNSDSREKTYSSVLETLPQRLALAPSGNSPGSAVGILILTDAAPVFETHSPEDASLMLINQLGPRPYMVGALGARSESCMDTSYANNEFSEELIQADPSKINWLNEFVALNQGYNWSICADDRDEEAELLERSVKDYMIMLMEEAQCMVMM
ncbi:MAG: hypothetical protein HRT45_15610 [Bdellovibrionales bacterium]|nr:hypothetical protein [Bdellovibrionales bacterium]